MYVAAGADLEAVDVIERPSFVPVIGMPVETLPRPPARRPGRCAPRPFAGVFTGMGRDGKGPAHHGWISADGKAAVCYATLGSF